MAAVSNQSIIIGAENYHDQPIFLIFDMSHSGN